MIVTIKLLLKIINSILSTLIKASNECQRGINTSFTEDGEPIDEMFENWSDFTYNGIIIDYCEIPAIPSDILI